MLVNEVCYLICGSGRDYQVVDYEQFLSNNTLLEEPTNNVPAPTVFQRASRIAPLVANSSWEDWILNPDEPRRSKCLEIRFSQQLRLMGPQRFHRIQQTSSVSRTDDRVSAQFGFRWSAISAIDQASTNCIQLNKGKEGKTLLSFTTNCSRRHQSHNLLAIEQVFWQNWVPILLASKIRQKMSCEFCSGEQNILLAKLSTERQENRWALLCLNMLLSKFLQNSKSLANSSPISAVLICLLNSKFGQFERILATWYTFLLQIKQKVPAETNKKPHWRPKVLNRWVESQPRWRVFFLLFENKSQRQMVEPDRGCDRIEALRTQQARHPVQMAARADWFCILVVPRVYVGRGSVWETHESHMFCDLNNSTKGGQRTRLHCPTKENTFDAKNPINLLA